MTNGAIYNKQIQGSSLFYFTVGIAAIFHSYTFLYPIHPIFSLSFTLLWWGFTAISSLGLFTLLSALATHTLQGSSKLWHHQAGKVVCFRIAVVYWGQSDLLIQKTVVHFTQRNCRYSFFLFVWRRWRQYTYFDEVGVYFLCKFNIR